MKQGRCALCLKEGKALCESHFISAGIYRRTGKDRVVMTPEVFLSVSNHVKDHLLCQECEQKFGDAENCVIPLLRQTENSFPLFEMLKASKPLCSGRSGSLVYSAPTAGIDINKFCLLCLQHVLESFSPRLEDTQRSNNFDALAVL